MGKKLIYKTNFSLHDNGGKEKRILDIFIELYQLSKSVSSTLYRVKIDVWEAYPEKHIIRQKLSLTYRLTAKLNRFNFKLRKIEF